MEPSASPRNLPAVEAVLRDERLAGVLARVPRQLAVREVRGYLDELRGEILGGGRREFAAADLADRLEKLARPSLGRAINAQGVVLHTGLGRAPLSRAAQRALVEVSANYCGLAIDRATGRRGERYRHVEMLLRELTGAEAAMVVNNNAAATLLILNTLAAGKAAIVSRGQLVEIGGAFRIPDIMARSGVRMVEVGTTNRTHLRDYRAAITPETGMIIRVHMSNYRIVGFTREVALAELVALGRESGIPVVDDLGSGALVDLSRYGLPREPTVQESVAAGADVICFSGDKLLGGPQCGIIIGRRDHVEAMKRNPLTRALRCDKLTYAALEATLRLFLDETTLLREHAVLAQMLKPLPEMRRQARRLLRLVNGLAERAQFSIADATSEVGSGSLATEQLPTLVVAVRPGRIAPDELALRLRRFEPPVYARVGHDALLLDFRTIREDETGIVARALRAALAQPADVPAPDSGPGRPVPCRD